MTGWRRCLAVAMLVAMPVAVTSLQAQPDTRRSGRDFMSPAVQALQDDDAQNPAFLWLKAGEQRFNADCARCHSADSQRGVAARYPAWDTGLAKPITLSARIQQCQVKHVRGAALASESEALLELETFVGHRSRGLPMAPPDDARLAPFVAQGERLYRQRFGQLDFSCAQCHDQQAGGRLGGSTIPQGHATAYPIYRLEWQGMGSLQRRLRHCMTGVRAEPFGWGSAELTALELYLARRAAGLRVETPGVRP